MKMLIPGRSAPTDPESTEAGSCRGRTVTVDEDVEEALRRVREQMNACVQHMDDTQRAVFYDELSVEVGRRQDAPEEEIVFDGDAVDLDQQRLDDDGGSHVGLGR